MANKNKSQIEQIREQLVNQPFEDVYSLHYAGKEMTPELFNQFLDSFDTNDLDISDFNKTKHNLLMEWVGIVQNKRLTLNKFPSFINFYINHLYKDNGLRNRMSECDNLVLEKELEKSDDYEGFVEEYEFNLLNKNWCSDEDKRLWSNLQQKRKIVIDFEKYLYDLEIDLQETWIEDDENTLENYKKVYKEHIDKIKIEIAEIKLFKNNLLKIPMLENLIEYFTILKDDYANYNNFNNKSVSKLEFEEFDFPLKLEDQEKFVFCSKLGVIEFLKEKIKNSKVNYTDSKLYPLISFITGNKESSVRRLMSFYNNQENSGDNNPFKDRDILMKVDRYLINNDLVSKGE